MGTVDEAKNLTAALENISVQDLLDLNEDDTARLALAFESFVDKIAEVIRRVTKEDRRMIN